jgi:CheY-like chemotaxis protein
MSILPKRKLLPRSNTPLMYRTILVVDDDPLYVELVKDVLEMRQHEVVVAYNGADALSLAATKQFDAIISDVEMPLMNGIVFHQKLLENRNYSNVPFVFLTATEDPDKLRYVREHPPALLLRKSDMVENLLTMISDLTEVH